MLTVEYNDMGRLDSILRHVHYFIFILFLQDQPGFMFRRIEIVGIY